MTTTRMTTTAAAATATRNDDIAKARWGLLRAALTGTQPDEREKRASIHCFPGFQLVSRRQVVDDDPSFLERLQQQECDSSSIEPLLWALHCCNAKDIVFRCTAAVSEQVRNELACKGILCRKDDAQLLRVWLPPNTDYICVDYRLPNSSFLRVRELLPRHGKIKLEDLVSQQHHDGVDNTSNACVWDSESTLTYCLLQEEVLSTLNLHSIWELPRETTPLQVLELGAGMAGLAGLALAVQNPCETRVVLTDGHVNAVLNNRVNIELTRATTGAVLNVTAKRLVWTATIATTDDDKNFDLLLASDCTHFVEFHACLAITAARSLRVGGVALFCQPPRGTSLQKFVSILNTTLWHVHWHESERISQVHQFHAKQSKDYNPDIHRPLILVLQKRRPLTDADVDEALKHMERRKQVSG